MRRFEPPPRINRQSQDVEMHIDGESSSTTALRESLLCFDPFEETCPCSAEFFWDGHDGVAALPKASVVLVWKSFFLIVLGSTRRKFIGQCSSQINKPLFTFGVKLIHEAPFGFSLSFLSSTLEVFLGTPS